MTHAQTIVALSSSIHAAHRAIVRMSGVRSFELLESLSSQPSTTLEHARHCRRRIEIGPGLTVEVKVYPFRAPRSSTGEDVIELHLPGSPFLIQSLLRRLVEQGARPAEPGEFTARAFFNGKLDLTSAEGVAATIAASNRAELDAARQLLGGELARRLAPILDELVRTLALIEVGIDFVEEDVSFISHAEVSRSLDTAERSLGTLIDESPRIERLSHEPRIVLTGRPNAGKSTLLNALAGTARAVVSDVAGTTRDALSVRIPLSRGFITLIDVAGIDSVAHDPISHQMQSAATTAIAGADAVVLLVDASDARPQIEMMRAPDLVVYSKLDLAPAPDNCLGIDARIGAGLQALRSRLDVLAFGSERSGSSRLALNARHAQAVAAALESIGRARDALPRGAELVSAELRLAIEQIGSIIGTVSPDDVLGRIFAGFCIGK